jgi:hypothetical protein
VEGLHEGGEALGRRYKDGDEEWWEFRSRMRQGFREILDGFSDGVE